MSPSHYTQQKSLNTLLDEGERDDNQAPVADAGVDQEGTTYYDDALERIVLDGI